MKIDLTMKIEKPNGGYYLNPLLDEHEQQIVIDGEPLWAEETTLKDSILQALLSIPNPNKPGAVELTPKEKFERYDIYSKVKNAKNDSVNLEDDEIKLIRRITDEVYPMFIMGQIRDYFSKLG